jgi:vacuolar-type H+-ATPase subunit I/STV1
MGRPRYGKVDPTLFMFFTYPLFFGLILGDIVYGAATMGFAYFLYKKIGHTETGMLASKFIAYIGFATVVFGYIFGEFAGYEILPHAYHEYHNAAACSAAHYNWVNEACWGASHAPGWATWVTSLYPFGGQIHLTTADLTLFSFAGVTGLPFGMEIAFPFHRVVPVSAGGNLENLILLTIYMGVVHVLLGLVIGFRDIWLHGDAHGNTGPIVALFDRGSWIIILVGGFMFGYGFLTLGAGQTSAGYIEFLTSMRNTGGMLALVGMVMLIYASWKYHGLPFIIGALLGPIEAIGMMPTVISYVRLFAVGMAGVKIAETGNNMLYGTTPNPEHHIEGAGMLDAVAGLGDAGVAGLLLFLAVAPVLAAIAIKLFSKRLPAEASRFGLLHGMTLSGVIGMVLLNVDAVTVLTVLSPFVIVPGLAFVLASLDRVNLSTDAQIRLAELASWLFGLILVGGVYMVVTLALAWIGLQFFAWGLGLASPNIHTARLHLVEWMKQFYEAVGEAFEPFGFTARAVEVE